MAKITVHGGATNAAEVDNAGEVGVPPAPTSAAPELATEAVPQPEAATVPDSVAVPDGTVEAVLAWVGDDPERAQRALDYERAKPIPRITLVAELEKQTV